MLTSPYRAYGCQTVLVSLSKLLNKKSEGTDNEKGDFNNCRNASDCITGQRRNHSTCTGR